MRTFRKAVVLGTCLSGLLGVAIYTEVSGATQAKPATSQPPAQSQVARGKYLVTVAGCNDCHTPWKMGPQGPEPDMSRMLSGHPENVKVTQQYSPAAGSPWIAAMSGTNTAWSGPWGISFTANLTPDTLTGLRSGVWSEGVFIKALRTGKHMGVDRPILPPMPWKMIGQMTDEDLKAMWAYLGTIPPIKNHVPDPVPPPASKTQAPKK